jgi:hypothetical protein
MEGDSMTDESNLESGPDPTPPNVRPVSPTSGQTGLSTDARVTAGFDEAMDAATINASTFELRDASRNLVSANVTYDAGSKTATLTPNSPLDNSKTYTATLKGGDNGVKDAAGNGLAEDMSWSFTTAAPTPTSPPYGFYFAGVAICAGLIAYVATIVALIAFTAELDSAAVTGALGGLFTLIGTVSGAYFGIKSGSDTEDKGRAAEREANAKATEAEKVAREYALKLNPSSPGS